MLSVGRGWLQECSFGLKEMVTLSSMDDRFALLSSRLFNCLTLAGALMQRPSELPLESLHKKPVEVQILPSQICASPLG